MNSEQVLKAFHTHKARLPNLNFNTSGNNDNNNNSGRIDSSIANLNKIITDYITKMDNEIMEIKESINSLNNYNIENDKNIGLIKLNMKKISK